MNKRTLSIILIFLFSTTGSLTAMIKIGPISISGLFSILVPALTFSYYFLLTRYSMKQFKPNLPLALLVLACISWDFTNLLKHQYFPQNMSIVLAGFAACILIPSLSIAKNYAKSIYALLSISSTFYIALLAIVLIFFQEEPAFVQVGVIFFTFHIAKYFLYNNGLSLAIALLIFLATLTLNSRIVIIAELAIFGIAIITLNRKKVLMNILLVSATLIVSLAFTQTEMFQSSVYGGDQALDIGGVSINTSGRLYQWTIIFDSFLNNIFFGSGFSIPEEMRSVERWNHPHNDYLRLLHHLGVVGLSLWGVFAFLVISETRKTLKLLNFSSHQPTIRQHKTITYTCAGSFIGLLIMMLTDNSMVYNYVMYPIGILIGSLPIIRLDLLDQRKMTRQPSEA